MVFDADTVSTIIGAIGISSIIVAVINTLSNRKKVGADVTKVITDAAVGVVSQLQIRVKDLLTEVVDLRLRDTERDHQEMATYKLLLAHQQWDLELVRLINNQLKEYTYLLPPPPLFVLKEVVNPPPNPEPEVEKEK